MNYLTESEFLQSVDSMLDECYPVTKIGYSEFDASYIMKHLDPIAYRECCNDYANSLIEDGYVIEGYNDEDENE